MNDFRANQMGTVDTMFQGRIIEFISYLYIRDRNFTIRILMEIQIDKNVVSGIITCFDYTSKIVTFGRHCT